MVLSVAEKDELLIEKKHLTEALVWLDEVEETMLSAFGIMGNNPLAKGMKEVFDFVAAYKKGVNQKEATRNLIKDYGMREINEIVAMLTMHDYCVQKIIGPHSILFPGKEKL